MVKATARARRKETGKRYVDYRKKKKFELAGIPAYTKLDKRSIRKVRIIGGRTKIKSLSGDIVNLFDPKTKKYEKVKIKTVAGNPANRHFVRRNILTKGTIIDTDKGKAKITSRPGQEGAINAVQI